MRTDEEKLDYQEAIQCFQRMQNFDSQQLIRDELGVELNFRDAVESASRLVNLYKQLAISAFDDFPVDEIRKLKRQANSDYNKFEQILQFNTKQSEPHDVRIALIKQVEDSYAAAFKEIHEYISYSASKSTDFQRLDREARATVQSIQDKTNTLMASMEEKNKAAEAILIQVQKVAAEQGVSQQAIYFQNASKEHDKKATQWLCATCILAICLLVYSFASFFLHTWLKPTDTYQTIQLAVSKVLMFAVIAFMLYLSSRNFLAHKHNSIVNKHRQNALMTFQALVDASKAGQDIVLTHAASCIFSPQCTGYTTGMDGTAPSAKSVIELLGKPMFDHVK